RRRMRSTCRGEAARQFCISSPIPFSVSVVLEAAAAPEQERLAIVDHPAIDAHPADLAREAAMLDLGAAVHHHGQAGLLADLLGLRTDHAQLHPQHLD